jgi:ribonuclease D
VVTELAAALRLPPENLVSPEFVRRLAWEPPTEADSATVAQVLSGLGARLWQAELLATGLATALCPPDD